MCLLRPASLVWPPRPKSPVTPKSVLFFMPTWPDTGSAAGVRTHRLIEAAGAWWGSSCKVAIATATPRNQQARGLEKALGVLTYSLPLNSAAAMRSVLEATEPDVAVFDRYYMEEVHSHALRALVRPWAER